MIAELITVDLVKDVPEPGREAAFLVLLAFLCSFGFIRTSARMTRSVSWWPGGVETEGGVHLHHLVWGIVLLLVCGFTAFATELSSPWWQLTSIGFGIGAGSPWTSSRCGCACRTCTGPTRAARRWTPW